MDHLGFAVENVDELKADEEGVVRVDPVLNPIPAGKGKEQGARLDVFNQQCPIGQHFLSEPDYTMIAVSPRQ